MLKKNFPNFITILNLASGVAAIISFGNGELSTGALFILLAAIFDFLDGAAARFLNAQSLIGKQLDSLADIISFGVAPGLLIFNLLVLADNSFTDSDIIAYTGILIPVFSAIRLARFNIDDTDNNDFKGLAVPANAIMIASFPLICSQEINIKLWLCSVINNCYFLVIYSVVSSFLLVSRIKMFSLKFAGLGFWDNAIRYIFLILSLFALIIFAYTAIPFVITAYIIISIVRDFTMRFLK